MSPGSFGATLGRPLQPGHDFFPAELAGYGRRWNYGALHLSADVVESSGLRVERTIVALGVVAAPGESVNGAVGWVEDAEVAELDRRERHYDRVDITELVSVETATAETLAGSIVTYVPRPVAIEHYERGRDAGTAAIELRYWRLVDEAFRSLGLAHHRRYLDSTPLPDVPVLDMVRR